MTIPREAFIVKAGNRKILEIAVDDPDTGGPLDLTGVQAITFEAAPLAAAPSPPVFTKTLGDGVEVFGNPLDGLIHVSLAESDTAELQGTFRHETRIIDAVGNVSDVFYPHDAGSATGWHFGVFVVEPQYIIAA